jgi:hypothetical protein
MVATYRLEGCAEGCPVKLLCKALHQGSCALNRTFVVVVKPRGDLKLEGEVDDAWGSAGLAIAHQQVVGEQLHF